ncbi:hypothetical protein MMC22_001732 [Lobaria immixta]|nr:hypothetical protein [Lobaria immixta]
MTDHYADQDDVNAYMRVVKDVLVLGAQTQRYKNGNFQTQIALRSPILSDLYLLRISNLTGLAEKRVFRTAEIHVQALFWRQMAWREQPPGLGSDPADWAGAEWIMDLRDVFGDDSRARSYVHPRDGPSSTAMQMGRPDGSVQTNVVYDFRGVAQVYVGDVAGVRPDGPLGFDAGVAALFARRKAKHQG